MNYEIHNTIVHFWGTLDEIKADIYDLEQDTECLLEQILGEAE